MQVENLKISLIDIKNGYYKIRIFRYGVEWINPSTPELNPSAQRCLTRFFTGDFAT
jgi:hypothetical protein